MRQQLLRENAGWPQGRPASVHVVMDDIEQTPSGSGGCECMSKRPRSALTRGAAISRSEYLPYGEQWVRSGDKNFAPKYNGQELDTESQFYYYNARHYNQANRQTAVRFARKFRNSEHELRRTPQIARFVTADTVVDGADTVAGWNRYMYVHGNPVMYKDPSGHFRGLIEGMMNAFAGGSSEQANQMLGIGTETGTSTEATEENAVMSVKDRAKAGLNRISGGGKFDYETSINGTNIKIPGHAWGIYRAEHSEIDWNNASDETIKAGLEDVMTRTNDEVFDFMAEASNEFDLKEIEVNGMYRPRNPSGSTTGDHIAGKGLDLNSITTRSGEKAVFRREDISHRSELAHDFEVFASTHGATKVYSPDKIFNSNFAPVLRDYNQTYQFDPSIYNGHGDHLHLSF